MLVNTDAELMNSIDGLAGLGCGSCFGTCGGKSRDRDGGIGSLGAGALWDTPVCRGGLAPSLFDWCIPPTPNEVIKNDNSMFGGNLSQASKDRINQVTQDLVDNDPNLQPTPGLFDNINWSVVIGVGLAGVLILKRI